MTTFISSEAQKKYGMTNRQSESSIYSGHKKIQKKEKGHKNKRLKVTITLLQSSQTAMIVIYSNMPNNGGDVFNKNQSSTVNNS